MYSVKYANLYVPISPKTKTIATGTSETNSSSKQMQLQKSQLCGVLKKFETHTCEWSILTNFETHCTVNFVYREQLGFPRHFDFFAGT